MRPRSAAVLEVRDRHRGPFGLNIFLLTDFEETFVMDSDLEFEDYMTFGFFRADRPQAYIFMRLNDIAARLLESPEKEQVQNSSLDTQRRASVKFCEQAGWTARAVFVEEGESAKTTKRPKLLELLRYCRENKGASQHLGGG